MKKLLSVLLVLVLMTGIVAVTASAAGTGSVQLSPGVTEAQPGASIVVSLNVTSNPGIMFFSFTPSYDARLELVSMAGSNSSWTCVTSANWDGANDETFTGNVVTLTFKVKDDASPGTASIGGSVFAANYDEEEISFSVAPCSITIKAAPHDHKFGDGIVTKEATCEEDGVRTYTCSICGETKTETIGAIGHKWGEWEQTKVPTCTEKGVETRVCANDSSHVETRELKMIAHTPSEQKEITKAPTCTETGTATGVCSVCGTKLESVEIPALGHDWKLTSEVKPTCEETGSRTYTCQNDPTHTKTETINALGHNWGEWKQTKAPTCTAKGVEARVCTNDSSHVETRTIQATGHTLSDTSQVIKEATCEEDGLANGVCSVCGEKLKEVVIPALGHKWKLATEVKPTCEDKGSKSYTCENDATHTKTEEIDALGHTWSKWTENPETGKHERTCSVCKKTESAEHSWDKGTVTRQPCAVDGEKTYTCADCGAKKTEAIPASADGKHNNTTKNDFNTYGKDANYHWLVCQCGEAAIDAKAAHQYTQEGPVVEKPTTTQEGKQIKYCVCGAETEVTLPKKYANYDDVPKTGDITGQFILLAAVCLLGALGGAYVLRRKLTR